MPVNYYRMFPEHHFAFVRIQSKTFSKQEALRLNATYKNDNSFSAIHYLLIMINEKCNPGFSARDLYKLSRIYTNEPQPNNHKKVIWLVSEPLITAMAHLFVAYTHEMYCSTLEKAYALMDMPMDYESFLRLISFSEQHVPE